MNNQRNGPAKNSDGSYNVDKYGKFKIGMLLTTRTERVVEILSIIVDNPYIKHRWGDAGKGVMLYCSDGTGRRVSDIISGAIAVAWNEENDIISIVENQ